MFTAVASLLLNCAVRSDVAMTGEISLRGRVMPVGGVKEKLLAAHRAGIKQVLIPEKNRRDLDDVPEDVRDDLEITLDLDDGGDPPARAPAAQGHAEHPAPGGERGRGHDLTRRHTAEHGVGGVRPIRLDGRALHHFRRDVLDEVMRALEPMAERQGIQLEIQPSPAPLRLVEADRTRFAQILMNFGSNGIKYNRPDGKVTFTVSTPGPERVRVTVADTGIGIPADKQDKLFRPFQRAGQETGPIQGTGIGLVITRRLAKLMHGEVSFHSVHGQGSTFWVDLPAHVAKEGASARPAARPEGARAAAREGRRLVLYVEDNPANVTFMRDLVDMVDGIDLLAAPTAEIGVELARAHRPAIVIMDINLPGMSGIDALRAAPETSAIPVIALTAAASERDRQRGEQAGFFRYLTKPIRVEELVSAIEAALSR